MHPPPNTTHVGPISQKLESQFAQGLQARATNESREEGSTRSVFENGVECSGWPQDPSCIASLFVGGRCFLV
ncbi:hypothetical protein N7478_003244 [Penicillium angulare]|uniref:uncharacterized protein n=1 Tax=Penicillium angulare TaxID=116970 RepID=UPI0025421220|nr:uncharacterized protein N7478_003244 [Penicillium angulare]KAJ5287558.1 hypothetical protein N7478_003244 [Penicillium angulare]